MIIVFHILGVFKAYKRLNNNIFKENKRIEILIRKYLRILMKYLRIYS